LTSTVASTGYIDATVPCNASIVISQRLLYHGVTIALIPPTLTPDYVLDLNILRGPMDENFEAWLLAMPDDGDRECFS